MLSRKQIHELVDLVLDVHEKTTNFIICEIGREMCVVQVRTRNGPLDAEGPYAHFDFFDTYDDLKTQETFEQCISHLKRLGKENPREAATPQGK